MALTQNKRLEFHNKLVSALGTGYKVYFQPPETLKIEYPCVVYHRRYIDKTPADNITYLQNRQYSVTLVSRTPDDDAVDTLINFPMSRYINHSVVDNLNHDTFEITY